MNDREEVEIEKGKRGKTVGLTKGNS